MTTSLWKRQQVERREARILDAARAMLLERGYLGLTMDRLAEAADCSKGTLYEHFSCKEDVVIALVIQTAGVRAALFGRAATFPGRTRERMAALGEATELFVRLHPDHFRAEQVVRTSSLRDKTSPGRQAELRACELRCMSTAAGIVRDAVAQGDLQLPPDMTPEELTFALWSLSYGNQAIAGGGFSLAELGVPDPGETFRKAVHHLLDGLGWRPLSSEWDYGATRERVWEETFAAERQALAGAARASRGRRSR